MPRFNPELPPLPKPEDIENFPSEKGARVMRKSPQSFYVIKDTRTVMPDGGVKRGHVILGRIKDGRFYSMEEFRTLFHRNGRPREEAPVSDGPVRAYTGHIPLTQRRRPVTGELPLPEEIENFPHDVEGARLLRVKKVLYVVRSVFYREGGKRREERHYLGHVVDGRFYTQDEYRALFDRHGNRRAKGE